MIGSVKFDKALLNFHSGYLILGVYFLLHANVSEDLKVKEKCFFFLVLFAVCLFVCFNGIEGLLVAVYMTS